MEWLYWLFAKLEEPILDSTADDLRKILMKCCEERAALVSKEDPILSQLNKLICIITEYFGQVESYQIAWDPYNDLLVESHKKNKKRWRSHIWEENKRKKPKPTDIVSIDLSEFFSNCNDNDDEEEYVEEEEDYSNYKGHQGEIELGEIESGELEPGEIPYEEPGELEPGELEPGEIPYEEPVKQQDQYNPEYLPEPGEIVDNRNYQYIQYNQYNQYDQTNNYQYNESGEYTTTNYEGYQYTQINYEGYQYTQINYDYQTYQNETGENKGDNSAQTYQNETGENIIENTGDNPAQTYQNETGENILENTGDNPDHAGVSIENTGVNTGDNPVENNLQPSIEHHTAEDPDKTNPVSK